MILNILDSDGRDQWVHRFHVRVVPERPQHLVTQVVPDAVSKTSDAIEESFLPEDWSEDPDPLSEVIPEATPETVPETAEPETAVPETAQQEPQRRPSRRSRIPIPVQNSRYPTRERRLPVRYRDSA